MGWQERRYKDPGDEGGFRRALRRIFVEGDNFFSWAVPFFTVAGIRVKIHLIYIIYVISDLLFAIPQGGLGVGFRAVSHACMFVLVLLHEFGHCFACRRVGGEADEILMWPLGGLAYCRPPLNWKAAFITTAGGPAVNAALVPVTAGLMLLAGAAPGDLIFNPFNSSGAVADLHWGSWWKIAVFYFYFTNLVLLIFNLVLIMFPLDGARLLQELLWARIGYRRSMTIAVNVGLVMAVAVGIFGLLGGEGTKMLMGIALFCGMTCFYERQKLKLYDADADAPWRGGAGESATIPVGAAAAETKRYREAARRQEHDRQLQAEEDRILAKIGSQGMGSLTRKEKRALQEATDRRRKSAGN